MLQPVLDFLGILGVGFEPPQNFGELIPYLFVIMVVILFLRGVFSFFRFMGSLAMGRGGSRI